MCGHCSGTPYTPGTGSSPPACWRVTPQVPNWTVHAVISASAAPAASGQYGIAGRSLGPVEQPADLPDVAGVPPGPLVGEVPEQVRGRDDPVALFGHQGDAVAHPGIFDELSGLASE